MTCDDHSTLINIEQNSSSCTVQNGVNSGLDGVWSSVARCGWRDITSLRLLLWHQRSLPFSLVVLFRFIMHGAMCTHFYIKRVNGERTRAIGGEEAWWWRGWYRLCIDTLLPIALQYIKGGRISKGMMAGSIERVACKVSREEWWRSAPHDLHPLSLSATDDDACPAINGSSISEPYRRGSP